MKLAKVGQAVGTLNITASGGGDPRDVLDAKINQKLQDENWDEVTSTVVHLNKAGEEVTSAIILYTYKKYGEDETEAVAKKK